MPKKNTFKDYPNYLIVWEYNGITHTTEAIGARIAVDVYRQARSLYGNNVRMAKVVLNYGEEV